MAPEAAMQRPSTPRMRAARAVPSPPARPRVRSLRRRARRARRSARAPRSAATGIAAEAWRSFTRAESWASATPAGSAATASRPAATAQGAAGLLLLVGTANGGRRDRAADDAGDGDQREHVRERVEERAVDVPVVLAEALRERRREPEQKGGPEGAERPPLAEDERGERDEAPAGGHVLVEGVHEPDRQVRPAERGEDAGEGDGGVACGVDRDPDRVGRARVLPDRAQPQAERRPEHDDVRDEEERDREPDHQVE